MMLSEPSVGVKPEKTEEEKQAIRKNLLSELYCPEETMKWSMREQPWHRRALWLCSMGYTVIEVAHRMRKPKSSVYKLLRQPWARKIAAEMIALDSRGYLDRMLQDYAPECIRVLAELMTGERVNNSVKRTAASDLLDRYLGKPKQQVEVSRGDLSNFSDEELDRVIQAGKREEEQRAEKIENRVPNLLTG